MQEMRSKHQESAEDIFFGQVVMIWARWFLIAVGVMLTLWVTQEANELAVGIVPVVVLVAVNFYLHGRYLTQRPANPLLITAVGLVDLAVITAVVLVWPGGKGVFSPFYVLYFPVLLAFAFVMPRKTTVVFTALALAAYVGSSVVAEGIYSPGSLNPEAAKAVEAKMTAEPRPAPAAGQPQAPAVDRATVDKAANAEVKKHMLTSGDIDTLKVLFMRLITLAAMGGLGTYYWRIQRDRRRQATGEKSDLPVTPPAAAVPVRTGSAASDVAGMRSNPVAS